VQLGGDPGTAAEMLFHPGSRGEIVLWNPQNKRPRSSQFLDIVAAERILALLAATSSRRDQ
jgi:hypothetical protein